MNRHPALRILALIACVTFAAGNAAAGTAEDLQAVYRNYHNAVLATNMSEMLKWSVKSRNDVFANASAAARDEAIAFAAKLTPKTYKVTGSIIEPNGRDATLFLTADVTDKGKAEPLYGSVAFENEGGAWKVAASGWVSRARNPEPGRIANGGAPDDISAKGLQQERMSRGAGRVR